LEKEVPDFGFDLDVLVSGGRHSTGFRTLPVVAIAACGFAITST
jgi:hypothetical protein